MLTAKNCMVVGLSAVYKRNYSTSEGTIEVDADLPLPLRYLKSSHQDAALEKFLASCGQMSADNQFNGQGGLIAALIMEAEMQGKPAVTFKVITDQHPITLETLQAFTPIVNDLLGQTVNMGKIASMIKFKPVLKELNARSHGIYN